MVNTLAFDEIDPGSSPTNTIVFMTYTAPSGEWNLVKAAVRHLLISSHACTRTYRVANLCAGPLGRISYNMYYN